MQTMWLWVGVWVVLAAAGGDEPPLRISKWGGDQSRSEVAQQQDRNQSLLIKTWMWQMDEPFRVNSLCQTLSQ
jgi:hypothetical protein